MSNDKNYAPLRLHAQKSNFSFGVQILIRSETHIADPVVLREATSLDNALVLQPTCEINEKEAQSLMDDLWRIGIRPSNGEGNVGQIGALKDHLEDMRNIAFNGLSITKEK